jgi:DNA-binding transcriptional ArsR family regulator
MSQIEHVLARSLIFVHSALDDADLTANEFRVYCHIARRAGSSLAWPSVDSIGKVCRMHPDTARTALASLASRGMLRRVERPGQSNLYRLTDKSEWLPPRNEGTPLDSTPPKQREGLEPEPPRNKGRRRGSIVEGDQGAKKKPKSPIPSLDELALMVPDTLSAVQGFSEAWADWAKDRKDRGKPITLIGAREQLKLLSQYSRHSVQMIRSAINAGWQGLHPPRDAKPTVSREGRQLSDDEISQCWEKALHNMAAKGLDVDNRAYDTDVREAIYNEAKRLENELRNRK